MQALCSYNDDKGIRVSLFPETKEEGRQLDALASKLESQLPSVPKPTCVLVEELEKDRVYMSRGTHHDIGQSISFWLRGPLP